MSLIDPKITLAYELVKGLFNAGMEILDLIKGKDKLTDEELKAIIAREDKAQSEKIEKLRKLTE